MENRDEIGFGLHHRFDQTRLLLFVADELRWTEKREETEVVRLFVVRDRGMIVALSALQIHTEE